MGISGFEEMTRLAKVARPDICVLTNIGVAHMENLGSRDGILKAKTEMFAYMNENGTIILNGDDDKPVSYTHLLIGVLLETRESVDKLNHLLSDYGEYVIGRMGLPYKEKGIHIISIAVDAPNNIISALSGKLGMLPGVSTKTIYGKTT